MTFSSTSQLDLLERVQVNPNSRSRSWHCMPNPKYLIKIEQDLKKLRSPSSSSSLSNTPQGLGCIHSKLISLTNVYHSLNHLLSCTSTQQSLLRHDHGRLVEQSLDASVMFLSAIGTLRDITSVMKDRLGELQSVLRRKGTGVNADRSECQRYVNTYVGLRISTNKDIEQVVGELDVMMKNNKYLQMMAFDDVSTMDSTTRLGMMAKVLREVATTTVVTLRCLLISFSTPPVVITSKANRQLHHFMSKIGFLSNSITTMTAVAAASSKDIDRSELVIEEVASVDLALCSFFEISDDHLGMVVKEQMRTLEVGLRSMEISLDAVSRSLVQYRVSFLNMRAS